LGEKVECQKRGKKGGGEIKKRYGNQLIASGEEDLKRGGESYRGQKGESDG